MDAAAAGWLETIAKVGLGVASFGALLFLIRWLTVEVKESRVAFAAESKETRAAYLASLEKQHVDHASEMALLREHNTTQVRGLHDAIDDLGAEMRGAANGHARERGSRG